MNRTINDMLADLKNYPQREFTHELVAAFIQNAYAMGKRDAQEAAKTQTVAP